MLLNLQFTYGFLYCIKQHRGGLQCQIARIKKDRPLLIDILEGTHARHCRPVNIVLKNLIK